MNEDVSSFSLFNDTKIWGSAKHVQHIMNENRKMGFSLFQFGMINSIFLTKHQIYYKRKGIHWKQTVSSRKRKLIDINNICAIEVNGDLANSTFIPFTFYPKFLGVANFGEYGNVFHG